MDDFSDIKSLADFITDYAEKLGADAVDILGFHSSDFDINVRDEAIETLSRNTTKGLGIRLFKDHKMAFSSTNDWNESSLKTLINHNLQAAQFSTADEFNDIGNRNQSYSNIFLDTVDNSIQTISDETRIDEALELSQVTRNFHPKIKNIESASISTAKQYHFFADSNGTFLDRNSSLIQKSVQVLVGEGDQNQTAGWSDISCYESDLESNKKIAETAAQRGIERLNPKKIKTGKYSVIFDPSTASSFFSSIFPAFSGEMVSKGASFLCDDLSKPIGSEKLTVTDQPHLIRGINSKLWDSDGVPTKNNTILQNGIVTKFLYDTYYARKTGNISTGNAVRSSKATSGIGFHCLMVEQGEKNLDQLLSEMGTGILIRGTIGFGVDTVSGNYSKGAYGWFIENGNLSFPISDFTIAGQIKNMLKNLISVGNDRLKHGRVLSPSLLFSEMTVAGI